MCHRIKKIKKNKNSHGEHSNNILFSMPKVELTIERKTFTTNSRRRYRLVATCFMTRNSKNWHAFTMKIPRHLKCSLALTQHAWKQQNTAKGEHILMLNENTHTHTHQVNQNETIAVSLLPDHPGWRQGNQTCTSSQAEPGLYADWTEIWAPSYPMERVQAAVQAPASY